MVDHRLEGVAGVCSNARTVKKELHVLQVANELILVEDGRGRVREWDQHVAPVRWRREHDLKSGECGRLGGPVQRIIPRMPQVDSVNGCAVGRGIGPGNRGRVDDFIDCDPGYVRVREVGSLWPFQCQAFTGIR